MKSKETEKQKRESNHLQVSPANDFIICKVKIYTVIKMDKHQEESNN